MYYIVGLGNPGDQYADTRHNVGRSYLEQYAANAGYSSWNKSKPATALYEHGAIASEPVEFVLPETFMNKSGDTVTYYIDKHGAKPEEFVVLHDDVDLAIGEVKISKGRGDGGNNGIKSIIARTGSKDFIRVRIGIAPRHWWTGEVKRPKAGRHLEGFVLQRFTRKEQSVLEVVYKNVDSVLETIIKNGPEAAMNQFN